MQSQRVTRQSKTACAGFQNFFSFFGFDRLTGKSQLAKFGFFDGAASIVG
jgi:hypothetical protein